MKIITREEAIQQGLKHYFLGTPCSHGHVCNRYVVNYRCVTCTQLLTKRATENKYFKQNYQTNREHRLDVVKRYAKNNPEKVKKASRKWNRRNKKRMDRYRTEYYSNPVNRQRHLEKSKEYRIKHRSKYAAHVQNRNAQKIRAMPVWLTKDDLKLIEQLYEKAQWLTAKTRTFYVVDHYYPLKGKTVSGLHVPDNLRIITAEENSTKLNKHPEDLKKSYIV